jgi:hypothetical protein
LFVSSGALPADAKTESKRTEIKARSRTVIIGAIIRTIVVRRRCVIRTSGIISWAVIRPPVMTAPAVMTVIVAIMAMGAMPPG